jgi:chemotaxis protein CheC
MNHEVIIFDEDEQDFLQELLNISFGAATAIISNMLETFATLHIPQIKLLDVEEIQEYINNKFENNNEYFVFSQQFRGDMEGESIFISNFNSVKHLSVIMNDEDEDTEDVEEIIDLSSELMNIINSATIKDMAKHLGEEVFFAQPSVKNVKSNDIVKSTNLVEYRTVIVVSTVLDFEKENIKGTLYILLKPKTIELIKKAAQEFFEEE